MKPLVWDELSAPVRIAVCQHPNGEGVWWDVATHPHDGCIQECACTPAVYVLTDLALDPLQEIADIEGNQGPGMIAGDALKKIGIDPWPR